MNRVTFNVFTFLLREVCYREDVWFRATRSANTKILIAQPRSCLVQHSIPHFHFTTKVLRTFGIPIQRTKHTIRSKPIVDLCPIRISDMYYQTTPNMYRQKNMYRKIFINYFSSRFPSRIPHKTASSSVAADLRMKGKRRGGREGGNIGQGDNKEGFSFPRTIFRTELPPSVTFVKLSWNSKETQ